MSEPIQPPEPSPVVGDGYLQETEWQFDAPDLALVLANLARVAEEQALELVGPDVAEHVDRYFDSRGWHVHRAGYALRVRQKGSRAEATIKSLDRPQAGLRSRRELTETLESGGEPPFRLSGPLGEQLSAITGREPLRTLFTVQTRRTTFRVEQDGRRLGEVAVDQSTIVPRGDAMPVDLRRVEIEVQAEGFGLVRPFVEGLQQAAGLRPAAESKYELGLAAAGLEPEAGMVPGRQPLKSGQTIGSVGISVLARQLDAMLASEPGTRLGDDIEALHDMRVALRRLRAAMTVFGAYLPAGFEPLVDEMRWLANILGPVRDLDVQMAELSSLVADDRERAALEPLLALLRARRATVRAAMIEALDSDRYRQFVTSIKARLQNADPLSFSDEVQRPARAVAPRLIKGQYRRFRRRGERVRPGSPPEHYHATRIAGKRLRYTLEFLGPLYGEPARVETERLVRLQAVLGSHQDAYVALDRLDELLASAGTGLPPATLFLMGRLAERYRTSAAELRGQFPPAYRAVTGKRWQRLQRKIERRAK